MEREATRYVRHAMAMTLIMSMQSSAGVFPNITFLQNRNAAGNLNPPTGNEAGLNKNYLQDMLGLVEFDLYQAFLRNAGIAAAPGQIAGQTLQQLTDRMAGFGSILAALGTELGAPANAPWDGNYPHGCSWILREAVAKLLS
jgi:hypothetical protein